MKLGQINDQIDQIRFIFKGYVSNHELTRICLECRHTPDGVVKNDILTEGLFGDLTKAAVLKAQTTYHTIPPAIKKEPLIDRLLQTAAQSEESILTNDKWWEILTGAFKKLFKMDVARVVETVRNQVSKKADVWVKSIQASHEEEDLADEQSKYDVSKKYKDVSGHGERKHQKKLKKAHRAHDLADIEAERRIERQKKYGGSIGGGGGGSLMGDETKRNEAFTALLGAEDHRDRLNILAKLAETYGEAEANRLWSYVKKTKAGLKAESADARKLLMAMMEESNWLKRNLWDKPKQWMKDQQDKAAYARDTGAANQGSHDFSALFSKESRKQFGRSSVMKALNNWIAIQAVSGMVEAVRKIAGDRKLEDTKKELERTGGRFALDPDTGRELRPGKKPGA